MAKKFDVVLTNPPFQDVANRGKTRHKLWIDFTQRVFDELLADGGILSQVSPSSFRSPSNRILRLMQRHRTVRINFDTGRYFPRIASSFSNYLIYKVPDDGSLVHVREGGIDYDIPLDDAVFYLPNVTGPEALNVHSKVIFHFHPKIVLERDYVTCHNILLKRSDTLSKSRTDRHCHPVFHTNNQVWWSAVQQEFATTKKVMWSRSGYTRPFYDPGNLGCTDMAYFVRVETDAEGENLAHNLNLPLMRYIYKTAKWSGFGNEKVFDALPALPTDRALTERELYVFFGLNEGEVEHVRRTLG